MPPKKRKNTKADSSLSGGKRQRIESKPQGKPGTVEQFSAQVPHQAVEEMPAVFLEPRDEFMDLLTSIQKGLHDTSQLPLGDKSTSKPIGAFVKAYWDEDDVWYDGRVLLFDPKKNKHLIYFAFDGTSEWMDVSPGSEDAVLLVDELVIVNKYPAMKYTGTDKGLAFVRNKGSGTYIEYFPHTRNKPGDHAFVKPGAIKPLLRFFSKVNDKKSSCAFQNARAEMVEITRIRQMVLDECKKCMMKDAHGYDWIGTRVRAFSYALSTLNPSLPSASLTGSGSQDDPPADDAPVELADRRDVLTVKCLGKIADYCPGINEHFILFDEEFIAPRWLSLSQHERDGKPQDVEILLDWALEEDESAGGDEPKKPLSENGHKGAVCELCHQGTVMGTHGVVTCSVCGLRHLHKHCMPMSKMQLSENQEWRCWHCTCCHGCGTSSWVAPLETTSMRAVMHSEEAPPDNVGLCSSCISKYKRNTKDFCQICFRLYGPLEIDLARHPLAASTTIEQLANSEANDEENDRMIQCNECSRWIHSKCEGIDQAQYEAMTYGTHPVWGDEYLCPHCRVQLSLDIIRDLKGVDKTHLFWEPVTAEMAESYFDVIRNPMDLSTMHEKAKTGKYKSLQSLRNDFELMCLNAITFNKMGDEYWNDTKTFFNKGVKIFMTLKRKTHLAAYGLEYQNKLKQQQKQIPVAPSETEVDGLRRKRDTAKASQKLLTGNAAKGERKYSRVKGKSGRDNKSGSGGEGIISHSVQEETYTLVSLPPGFPKSRAPPPNPLSIIRFADQVLDAGSAFYDCCLDICGACGSPGDPEHFLFCAECGECFHSFCVDAPYSEMCDNDPSRIVTVPGPCDRWRCPNCYRACMLCQKKVNLEDKNVLLCRVCENPCHTKCVPSPRPIGFVEEWTCGDCMVVASRACSSCEKNRKTESVPGQYCIESMIGNVFFRDKYPWGIGNKCMKCVCSEKYLGHHEDICDFISLDTSCVVCKNECANVDPECVRQCLSCFRYSHTDCDGLDTQTGSDLCFLEGEYMCDECWVAHDPDRFCGDINILRAVREIESHQLGLTTPTYGGFVIDDDDGWSNSFRAKTHMAIISWAAHRCQALQLLCRPAEEDVRSMPIKISQEYQHLPNRARTFLRIWKPDLLRKQKCNDFRQCSLLCGGLKLSETESRSPSDLLHLATLASAFLLVTDQELGNMAPSCYSADTSKPLWIHLPPVARDIIASEKFIAAFPQQHLSTSMERVIKGVIKKLITCPTEPSRKAAIVEGRLPFYSIRKFYTPLVNDEYRWATTAATQGSRRRLNIDQECSDLQDSSVATEKPLKHEEGAVDSKESVGSSVLRKKNKKYVAVSNDIVSNFFCSCEQRYCSPSVRESVKLLRPHATANLCYGSDGWSIGKNGCSDAPVSRSIASASILPMNSLSGSVDQMRLFSTEEAVTWRGATLCVFCKESEDNDILGRLLPIPQKSCVAHVNCIRASSGVEETECGEFQGVEAAIERAVDTSCHLCEGKGASVRCERARCGRKFVFHLKCAACCEFAFRYHVLNKNDGLESNSKPSEELFRNGKWNLKILSRCHIHTSSNFSPSSAVFGNVMRRLLVSQGTDDSSIQSVQNDKVFALKGGSAYRQGCVTVHRLGRISFDLPGHHTKDYIYPIGFCSTRLYWSMTNPQTRTIYTFEIQSREENSRCQKLPYPIPKFVVAAADQPGVVMTSSSVENLYIRIVEAVRACNGGQKPLLAMEPQHASSRQCFGHNAWSFFGIDLDIVRQALERELECAALVAPTIFFESISTSECLPQYKPRFHIPSLQNVRELIRRRVKHLQLARKNQHGSSRAEGYTKSTKSFAGRPVRNLAKATEENSRSKQKSRGLGEDDEDDGESELEASLIKARLEARYFDLARRSKLNPEERLCVKRSDIHGWGLFTKTDFPKDSMIIEYIGEKVRQPVADIREEQYEQEGVGSCYLFRLDKEFIVDATRTGGMARFMNHCCEPNAYAQVVSTSRCPGSHEQHDDSRSDSHIVIFATRNIRMDEEVMYDYKFPVEDVKLPCYCGAPKCRGSMN